MLNNMIKPFLTSPSNQPTLTAACQHSRGPHQLPLLTDLSVTSAINQVDYCMDKPWLTEQQVLPLLQQVSQQSRWQLWFTPGQKLSRSWLQSSGLPMSKMILISQLQSSQIVEAMISALQTGNYSLVVGCLPYMPGRRQYQQLLAAAQTGKACALLIRAQFTSTQFTSTTAPCQPAAQQPHWYH